MQDVILLLGIGRLCLGFIIPLLLRLGYENIPIIACTDNPDWLKHKGASVIVENNFGEETYERYEILLYHNLKESLTIWEFIELCKIKRKPGLICMAGQPLLEQLYMKVSVVITSLGPALEEKIKKLMKSSLQINIPVNCFENNENIVMKAREISKRRFKINDVIVHRVIINLTHVYGFNKVILEIDPRGSSVTMMKNDMATIIDPKAKTDGVILWRTKTRKDLERARMQKHCGNCTHYVVGLTGYSDGINRGESLVHLTEMYMKDCITEKSLLYAKTLTDAVILFYIMLPSEQDLRKKHTDRLSYAKESIAYFDYMIYQFKRSMYEGNDSLGRILNAKDARNIDAKAEKFIAGKLDMYNYLKKHEASPEMKKVLHMEYFKDFSLEKLVDVLEILQSENQKLKEIVGNEL